MFFMFEPLHPLASPQPEMYLVDGRLDDETASLSLSTHHQLIQHIQCLARTLWLTC